MKTYKYIGRNTYLLDKMLLFTIVYFFNMSLYRNEGFSYSRKSNHYKRKRYFQFGIITILAIALAILTRQNILYPILAHTNALEPVIPLNSLLLVSTLNISKVSQNEILVVTPDTHSENILCHVVSTENSTMYLDKKQITIKKNRQLSVVSSEKFLIKDTKNIPTSIYPRDTIKPMVLESGEFACLNLDWDNIYDSRTYGKFSTKNIVGKVILKNIIYPLPSFFKIISSFLEFSFLKNKL